MLRDRPAGQGPPIWLTREQAFSLAHRWAGTECSYASWLSMAGQGPLPDGYKQSGAREKQGDIMGPSSGKICCQPLNTAGLCCPAGG